MIEVGQDVPSVQVARLEGDLPVPYDIRDILRGHRTLTFGVPQAFSPVCSQKHIPGIIASLDKLRGKGFTQFIVIAPDNPWAMAVWQEQLDVGREMLFLSDGNNAFVEACGLKEHCAGLFLGECSKRFAIHTIDHLITSLAIEESILTVEGTGPSAQADRADAMNESGIFEIEDTFLKQVV